jgi:hypothetical protein
MVHSYRFQRCDWENRTHTAFSGKVSVHYITKDIVSRKSGNKAQATSVLRAAKRERGGFI